MSANDAVREALSFLEAEQSMKDDELSILAASIWDEEMYGISFSEIMQDECPDRYSVSEDSSSIIECIDLNKCLNPVEENLALSALLPKEPPVKICRVCGKMTPLAILLPKTNCVDEHSLRESVIAQQGMPPEGPFCPSCNPRPKIFSKIGKKYNKGKVVGTKGSPNISQTVKGKINNSSRIQLESLFSHIVFKLNRASLVRFLEAAWS
jgi:hypothetical protein